MKKKNSTSHATAIPGTFPDWAPPVLVKLYREKFEGKSFQRRPTPTVDDLSVLEAALIKLISHPEMEAVWKSLRRQWQADEKDCLPNTLLAVIYDGLMSPRHPWTGLTRKDRTRKVEKIRRLTRKLRDEVAGTPLGNLSKAAVRALGVDSSSLDAELDFTSIDFYLSQLDRRAAALLRIKGPGNQTKGRLVARRHLIPRLNRYLAFQYGDGLLAELATISQVVLADEDIDIPTVEKILARH